MNTFNQENDNIFHIIDQIKVSSISCIAILASHEITRYFLTSNKIKLGRFFLQNMKSAERWFTIVYMIWRWVSTRSFVGSSWLIDWHRALALWHMRQTSIHLYVILKRLQNKWLIHNIFVKLVFHQNINIITKKDNKRYNLKSHQENQ